MKLPHSLIAFKVGFEAHCGAGSILYSSVFSTSKSNGNVNAIDIQVDSIFIAIVLQGADAAKGISQARLGVMEPITNVLRVAIRNAIRRAVFANMVRSLGEAGVFVLIPYNL